MKTSRFYIRNDSAYESRDYACCKCRYKSPAPKFRCVSCHILLDRSNLHKTKGVCKKCCRRAGIHLFSKPAPSDEKAQEQSLSRRYRVAYAPLPQTDEDLALARAKKRPSAEILRGRELLRRRLEQQTQPVYVECPQCTGMVEIIALECGEITHGTGGENGCGAVFQVTKAGDEVTAVLKTQKPILQNTCQNEK